MDEEQPIKLTLSGAITFDQAVTKSQAGQIIAFLGTTVATPGLDYAPKAAAVTLPATNKAPVKFETPRVAIDLTGAKTNPEKIVALAGYVLQEGSRETFSVEDIKPLFKRAGEITPKNMGRDLLVAIKNGYIDEADQKGEYYFTRKATSTLEDGFASDDMPRKRRKSSNRRPSQPKQQLISEELQAVEVSTTIPGYPGFYQLKTKSDKFLWVLALAKKWHVGSLTPPEVAFLSDNIGDAIPTNDVTSYFRVNQRKGFVNKSLQDKKIRLTPIGEEYLSSLSEGGKD
jgi:hypothetical protein